MNEIEICHGTHSLRLSWAGFLGSFQSDRREAEVANAGRDRPINLSEARIQKEEREVDGLTTLYELIQNVKGGIGSLHTWRVRTSNY